MDLQKNKNKKSKCANKNLFDCRYSWFYYIFVYDWTFMVKMNFYEIYLHMLTAARVHILIHVKLCLLNEIKDSAVKFLNRRFFFLWVCAQRITEYECNNKLYALQKCRYVIFMQICSDISFDYVFVIKTVHSVDLTDVNLIIKLLF